MEYFLKNLLSCFRQNAAQLRQENSSLKLSLMQMLFPWQVEIVLLSQMFYS
jgi:hypothetical protein